MAFVTGDKALDMALRNLKGKQGTIAVSGVRAGLAEISKAIKSEVPNRIRGAISHKLRKSKKSKVYTGKAGGGVGKKRKTSGNRKRAGVGISKQNVHWYLLGTSVRRQTTTGRVTGRMPPNKAVKRGWMKSRGITMSAVRRKMWERIKKEAAKTRR